jgi:hypothetical protein
MNASSSPQTPSITRKDISPPTKPNITNRVRFGLIITLFGFSIFLIGARPGLFGLDRSPVIGFVQISVFLVGLAIICLGGYASLIALWANQPRSILADFGVRLVATGFVIAVFAGMADVFGFGSNRMPDMIFGPWQARGVMFGEILIAVGFFLLFPYPRHQRQFSASL